MRLSLAPITDEAPSLVGGFRHFWRPLDRERRLQHGRDGPSRERLAPALTGRVSSQFAAPIDRSGFSGIGAGIARTAAPLAAAAAAAWAIGKTVAFVTSSVSQAADLEQSVGAVETVFKGSSDQMLSWSKSAATAVGLTQNEYNELGTLIGTQLKNGGTSMDELAGKTNDLIGVGADLSSMFGGTTADAVDALSSALKGERDPIERYGVSLNQASIDAKAAELGFDKVGGSLSQQANQAATLALIMQQTADAHGNFGKEADTLSHKQQVLNAMWENGKTQIGQAFLPAVSALAGVLISVLGPALDGAVKGVNFVSDAVRFVVGYINGKGADVDLGGWEGAFENVAIFIQNAIGTIGPVLGQIGAAFAPFIGQIGSAIGQLAPAFAQVLPSISPCGLILQALLPVLPQVVALVVELATALGPELVAVRALFVPLVAALGDLMRNQLAALLPFLVQTVGIVVGLFAVTGPAFLSFVAAVLPLVSSLVADVLPRLVELVPVLVPVLSAVAALIAAVGPVVGVLLGVLLPMVEGLTPVLHAATALVISVVTAALQVVQGVLLVATGLLSGNWAQVWSGLGYNPLRRLGARDRPRRRSARPRCRRNSHRYVQRRAPLRRCLERHARALHGHDGRAPQHRRGRRRGRPRLPRRNRRYGPRHPLRCRDMARRRRPVHRRRLRRRREGHDPPYRRSGARTDQGLGRRSEGLARNPLAVRRDARSRGYRSIRRLRRRPTLGLNRRDRPRRPTEPRRVDR